MVDSCRQLTVSQSNGDEDTAGMVTILTGHEVEELCSRSAAMKVSNSLYVLSRRHEHSGAFPPLVSALLASVPSSLLRVHHC